MNPPWGLSSKLKLLMTASKFFDLKHRAEHHRLIGSKRSKRTQRELFSVNDFLRFLEIRPIFPKPPKGSSE